MANIVRWGILGTGRIAHEFATALQQTPGAVLSAVASRSQSSADAFGAEFDGGSTPIQRFGSYDGLAAAEGVDLVYIGTPHPQHAENALLMLDGGKGVLCEKPFALNAGQARRVIERARERKLFLMEAMWTRYLPAIDEARRIIASGELGEVSQASADFGFAATPDPANRLFDPALGGGALLDVGIYPLSVLADLLGPVSSVQAQAEIGPTGVDLQTVFTLRHAGGALSACACSIKARTPVLLTLGGSKGHLRIDAPFFRPPSVTVTTADGEARTVATPYLGNGYVHEALEAQRCWLAGELESPRMTHEQTLALMGVLDEIRGQIGLRYPGE
jgi:predicted dehydrogenase